MKPTLVFCLAVLLALSSSGFAKGVTTRITISEKTAGTSVDITDPAVLARFNVWSGRGTFSTVHGQKTEGTRGFIVDWPAGVVSSRPQGLRQYEVRFYVRYPRSSDEQLAYVVLYESALAPTEGFVYIPGSSDEHYRLNVRAIHRGAGIEGHWFRASTSWQAEIGPLLPSGAPQSSAAKVVLLGTGTPAATPDRSGPATAIVVNDTAYLVDFGPDVVRRASAAAAGRGIAVLQPTRLQVAFATHLHSDHTVGYADLIFSPWTLGRRVPLEVYGPRGLKEMTSHLIEAYRVDIETRTNADGNQRTFPDGYKVNAHEIAAGVVYRDKNVTVTAFATRHAMESYGYRFDTPDRSIVISGDTNPTQATIDACRGCDILIHEVHTSAWLAARPEAGGAPPGTFRSFSEKYHTTTEQLGELARRAKPRLLILYHYNSLSPEELQSEMMSHYSGQFVIGRDLDVY